jgi:hypothetical protein
MTPTDCKIRPVVYLCQCTKEVPPAADVVIGTCSYYYRPLHEEYVQKSGVSGGKAIKTWLTYWNVWDDIKVVERLLKMRDKLIAPNNTDPAWSRHANFMMRHIGCGHQPPKYYVGYGYYYCSTYGERLKPRLSEAGRKWLDDARKSLQAYLEDGLKQNMKGDVIKIKSAKKNGEFSMRVKQYQLELDSKTFTTFAFNTHPLAYLDGGLADLPLSDLLKIGGQPNVEEWADGSTWNQAFDSLKAVGSHKATKTIDEISQTTTEMNDAVSRALARLLAK